MFPIGEIDLRWSRESGVGEGSNSNRNKTWLQIRFPKNSPPAVMTETKTHFASAIRLSRELPEANLWKADLVGRKPSMHAKDTSRSPLTVETVAHRDHIGLAFAANNELTAGALAFTGHKAPSK